MSEEVSSADFLKQHGFKDREHFNAVRDSLHNRGVLSKESTENKEDRFAVPLVAQAYLVSAKKGSERSSTSERSMNITMATGKVRPRPGELKNKVWADQEGYANSDTGDRILRNDVAVGFVHLDNPEQFWARPSTQDRPGRKPLVDENVSTLNSVYGIGLQRAKEEARDAHVKFHASKQVTQGRIDHAVRLRKKYLELMDTRRKGGAVTDEDIQNARVDYHDASSVARLAIKEHHEKTVARDAAVKKLTDYGLPMSGDDIGKMGDQRLVKNVILPTGMQAGEIERAHNVPAGVHLATDVPFKGYTGEKPEEPTND